MKIFHKAVLAVAVLLPGWGGGMLKSVGGQLAGAAEMRGEVTLSRGPLPLTVVYDTGREAWARYVLERTRAYLPAVESYLGVKLPHGKTIRIEGHRRVYLKGKWVGGSNWPPGIIRMEYRLLKVGNPALLYHELGHFWFGLRGREELPWMVEGVVSYLPLAMAEAGNFHLDPGQLGVLRGHWGFRGGFFKPDAPMLKDFRPKGGEWFQAWYRKTFKLQYLLHRELGAKNYRRLLQTFYAEFPINETPRVLSMLGGLRAGDWRRFLSGWVFPGAYARFSPRHFLDRDGDGLLDVEEHFARTDPANPDSDGDMIPDGAELRLKTDPLRRDPPETAARYGPFVDGNPAEWELIRSRGARDALGDSSGGPNLDLAAMSYLIRDGMLHVMVRTRGTPRPKPKVMFQVLADTDGDGQYDRNFGFFLDNPAVSWLYVVSEGVRPLPGLKGAMGRVFEMAIPLKGFRGKAVRILPILRDQAAGKTLDAGGKWVVVR
ncbi:MAG: hypothetical protein V3S64_11495 [bacterium]